LRKVVTVSFSSEIGSTTGRRLKDKSLLIPVSGSSRKYYLQWVPERKAWHYRLTIPRGCPRAGTIIFRSTGFGRHSKAAAKAKAKIDIEALLAGRWEDAEARKLRRELATIGEVLERYKARAPQRHRTVQSAINSLRNIVRRIHSGDPDRQSTSVLTADLVREFEQQRIRDCGGGHAAVQRTLFSTASYLRQARAIFSRSKLKFYEDINLPDLSGFLREPVDQPRRTRPQPLDLASLRLMVAARGALATKDPGAYVANLMFSCWGMRDIEIVAARTHWIEAGVMHIIDRPNENFYPKGCEGSFEVAAAVVDEILRFQDMCVDGYLVPGRNATERYKAVYRRHSQWVSQWIKNRTKTSYELRRYAGSRLLDMGATIMDVRDFLRHRDVRTTQQWYAYRLHNRKLPTIGLDNLVPKGFDPAARRSDYNDRRTVRNTKPEKE
jgi:hypothetical protein